MPVAYDMNAKNVFVFGGTSGINLGIAEAFANAGARLAVASRNPAKVDAAKAALTRDGKPASGYKLTHSADDGLLRLLILVHAKSGVLLGEAVQCFRKIHFGRAVLRGDRQ